MTSAGLKELGSPGIVLKASIRHAVSYLIIGPGFTAPHNALASREIQTSKGKAFSDDQSHSLDNLCGGDLFMDKWNASMRAKVCVHCCRICMME